jgi:hypothetical protein
MAGVLAGLASMLLVSSALAQDDPAPNLVCSGRTLRQLSPERPGGTNTFACRVVGAAPDETGFVLQASVADPSGQLQQTLDPFCSGDLTDGTGVCTSALPNNTQGGAAVNMVVLSVSGSLLPSGRALGPVAVTPSRFIGVPVPPELLPPNQN